ncbi:hypothetical protein [Streptomyces griseus]|uniref:hypothetical protein n=1 Tax=Streptomyces griseus TaxID=1911 RepID=UPI00055F88C6|nr:hypothetical protein [Streptomyces griseus]
MPLVLVEGAVIECSHGGTCRLTGPGSQQLTVTGQAVLLTGAEAGFTFGNAATPVPGMIKPCTAVVPASGAPKPCLTLPTVPVGVTVKLAVGDQSVLLATANGLTVSGTGPGSTWKISDPGQQTLEAV